MATASASALKRRKVRLLIAGRGQKDDLPSNDAHFLGEVHDLRPIYAAADIFILPTIYDPFSNACLKPFCFATFITHTAREYVKIKRIKPVKILSHGAKID